MALIHSINCPAHLSPTMIEDGMTPGTCSCGVVLREQNRIMREALKNISAQTPEKPDRWCACGQCDMNIDAAKEALDEVEEIVPYACGVF